MKKILIIALLFMIISSFDGTTSKAAGYILLWYSDADTISKFDSSSVEYGMNKMYGCDMVYSDYEGYIHDSVDEWDDEFGSISFSYNYSGGDIYLGCVTRAYANSRGWFKSWVGAGGISGVILFTESKTLLGVGDYDFYTHTQGYGFMIWDDDGTDNSVKTSEYKDAEWESIAAHEFGHAMGYKGHNTQGSSTLMHWQTNFNSPVTSPQATDINHMELIYGW